MWRMLEWVGGWGVEVEGDMVRDERGGDVDRGLAGYILCSLPSW